MYALVVDDDDMSILVVENVLSQLGYEIRVAHNGREALEVMDSCPVHLIITDWEMPEMNGIELCHQVRRRNLAGYVYIIMITGRNGGPQRMEGLRAGADNFLTKPLAPAELLVCMKTAERILSLETCEQAMVAMAKLVESRDSETGAHLDRVQAYVRVLATALSGTEKFRSVIDDDYIRLIQQTSTFHDIGKVAIPDAILLKPGKLDQRERAIMETHAMMGANTLDAALQRFPNAKYLHMARTIAATHHEKYDGTGYPARLAGDSIPLCGRIVAVADVYDALTTQRTYKPSMPHEQARNIILRDSGKHFDPEVVAAFLASETEFRLIGGKTGADEGLGAGPLLLPRVPAVQVPEASSEPAILVVEDDPMQRQMLLDLFRDNGCRVEAVQNPREALKLIQTLRPRIVISDWSMPEMNGTELCRQVRSLDQGQYIFFLIVTVHGEKAQMITAFDAGVDDFVIKPYHQGELLARVRAGMRTIRLHDEVNAQNQATTQLNTQLVRLNARLEKLATTDELTGLCNRRQALARLDEKYALAERYCDSLSVAMLDLDHFKKINDTYGHEAGDDVLRSVAATLQASVRATDTICRVGGEEFLIIFPAQTAEEAGVSAERCRAAVEKEMIRWGDAEIAVTISIGIASRRTGQQGATSLIREADAALYDAKHDGRNCVRIAAHTFVEAENALAE